MFKSCSTIGIVALSGPCEKDEILNGINNLKSLGYNVVCSKNLFSEEKYLAGTDEEKIIELHSMFENDKIDLILNARGGYGSIRLLEKIDYDLIKKNPKIFCGFSDITALLLMFYKKTDLITYHGPMLCSDFVEINQFTMQNFLKVINNESFSLIGEKVYQEGFANGILWGGNLSTVVSLCGQDFIPNEDFIFFTEDLNEPVYKIDKMFTQLFNIPKFKNNCKAIILGDFLNVDNKAWLEELFLSFDIPTVGGFKITHSKEKVTIPIGKKASLEYQKLKVL